MIKKVRKKYYLFCILVCIVISIICVKQVNASADHPMSEKVFIRLNEILFKENTDMRYTTNNAEIVTTTRNNRWEGGEGNKFPQNISQWKQYYSSDFIRDGNSTLFEFRTLNNDTSVTVNYDNIGKTKQGRFLGTKVKFYNFIMTNEPDTTNYPDINYPFMDISHNIQNGYLSWNFKQFDIEQSFYYMDTGEEMTSISDIYFTYNSLNKGEGIRCNTITDTYRTTQTNVQSTMTNQWEGMNDNFVDIIGRPTFTNNSLTIKTSGNKLQYTVFTRSTKWDQYYPSDMVGEGRGFNSDLWNTFSFAPLAATAPMPYKVGVRTDGTEVTDFGKVIYDEILTYKVKQEVQKIGYNGSFEYDSFLIADQVPNELTVQDAYVLNEATNTRLNASQVTIGTSGNQITATFNKDYLKNGMSYNGETYSLVVVTKVNASAFNLNATTFSNSGYTTINNSKVDVNPVTATPTKPQLTIAKAVSKYEWNSGENVDYTVTVSNTGEVGSLASNVVVKDLSLPTGLKVNNGINITGVPGATVTKSGTGWIATIPKLIGGTTATIKFQCRATETVYGQEVVNTATASADNIDPADNNNHLIANTKVWINTPALQVDKQYNRTYTKAGDVIPYHIDIVNNQVGTVARNIKIRDQVLTDGVQLLKTSVVLMDSDGNIIKDVPIVVNGNSISIDTGLNLVCAQDNYSIYDKENGGLKKTGLLNPLGIANQKKLSLEYEVIVTDEELAGKEVRNIAKVSSDEPHSKAEDEENVPIKGPILDVVKESDKTLYKTDEKGRYTLTVRQLREDQKAKNVVVKDEFQLDGMEIQKRSFRVTLNGDEIHPISLDVKGSSFIMKLGRDLMDTDKIKITYDVLFGDENLINKNIVNVATATADNAMRGKDDNTVRVDKGKAPRLSMKKTSDKAEYNVGDIGHYTVKVIQDREDTVARNVTITDEMQVEGVKLLSDTIKLIESDGVVATDAIVTLTKNGFQIESNRNLDYDEELTVTYDVVFESQLLAGLNISNIAKAKAVNAEETKAEREVSILIPKLEVKKTSDKEQYELGSVGSYKVIVKQIKEDAVAKDVVIKDMLETEGMEYVPESVQVLDERELDMTEQCLISIEGKELTVHTGKNLKYGKTITLLYDVRFQGETLLDQEYAKNTVTATGYNVLRDVKDEAKVKVLDPNKPSLEVIKTADKESYQMRDTITYTITGTQVVKRQTAQGVFIEDIDLSPGVAINYETVKVNGTEITWLSKINDSKVCGVKTEQGFQIYLPSIAYQETVTVTFEANVKDSKLKGKAVTNSANIKAENVTGNKESTVVVQIEEDPPIIREIIKTGDNLSMKSILFFGGLMVVCIGIGVMTRKYRRKNK